MYVCMYVASAGPCFRSGPEVAPVYVCMYVASVGPLFHAVTTLSLPVGLRWGLLRRVRYGAVDAVREVFR